MSKITERLARFLMYSRPLPVSLTARFLSRMRLNNRRLPRVAKLSHRRGRILAFETRKAGDEAIGAVPMCGALDGRSARLSHLDGLHVGSISSMIPRLAVERTHVVPSLDPEE